MKTEEQIRKARKVLENVCMALPDNPSELSTSLVKCGAVLSWVLGADDSAAEVFAEILATSHHKLLQLHAAEN